MSSIKPHIINAQTFLFLSDYDLLCSPVCYRFAHYYFSLKNLYFKPQETSNLGSWSLFSSILSPSTSLWQHRFFITRIRKLKITKWNTVWWHDVQPQVLWTFLRRKKRRPRKAVTILRAITLTHKILKLWNVQFIFITLVLVLDTEICSRQITTTHL